MLVAFLHFASNASVSHGKVGLQVALGAGALVAGAYVVKQYVIPFTSQAYERWAGKPLFGQSAAERAAEARTAELIAKAIQVTSHNIKSRQPCFVPACQQHLSDRQPCAHQGACQPSNHTSCQQHLLDKQSCDHHGACQTSYHTQILAEMSVKLSSRGLPNIFLNPKALIGLLGHKRSHGNAGHFERDQIGESTCWRDCYQQFCRLARLAFGKD